MTQEPKLTPDDEAEIERQVKATLAIEALLHPEQANRIVNAVNAQFMTFAPMSTTSDDQTSRVEQLNRVLWEYVVGAPAKLLNYWQSTYAGLVTRPRQHVGGSIVIFVMTTVMGLVAFPFAVLSFLGGLVGALVGAVGTRSLTFSPKADVIKKVRGE